MLPLTKTIVLLFLLFLFANCEILDHKTIYPVMKRLSCSGTNNILANNFGCLQDRNAKDSRTGYYNSWHFDFKTDGNGGTFANIPFWFTRTGGVGSEVSHDPFLCDADYCTVQGIYDPESVMNLHVQNIVSGYSLKLLGHIPYMRGFIVQSSDPPAESTYYNTPEPSLNSTFWDEQWTLAMDELDGPIVSACNSTSYDVTSFWYQQAFSQYVQDYSQIFSPSTFASYTDGLLFNQAASMFSKAVPYNDTHVLPLWLNDRTRKIMAEKNSDQACCTFEPISLSDWTGGNFTTFTPLTNLSSYFQWTGNELSRWRQVNPATVLGCYEENQQLTLSFQQNNVGPVCQVYEVFQKSVIHLPIKLEYIGQYANATLFVMLNYHTIDGTITVRYLNGDGSMVRLDNVKWKSPFLQSALAEQHSGGVIVVCGDLPNGLQSLTNPYSDDVVPETKDVVGAPFFYWIPANRTRGLDQQMIHWQRLAPNYCNMTDEICLKTFLQEIDWTDNFSLPPQIQSFYNSSGGSDFPFPCQVAGAYRRLINDPTNETLIAEARQYLMPEWHPQVKSRRQWLAAVSEPNAVKFQSMSKTFHSPSSGPTSGKFQGHGLPLTLMKNHPFKALFHNISFDLKISDILLKPYYDLKPKSGAFRSSLSELGLLRQKYPDRLAFPMNISADSTKTQCTLVPQAKVDQFEILDNETYPLTGSLSVDICPRSLPGVPSPGQDNIFSYQIVAECLNIDNMKAGIKASGLHWLNSLNSTVIKLAEKHFKYESHLQIQLPNVPLKANGSLADSEGNGCINIPLLTLINATAKQGQLISGRCRVELFDGLLKTRLRLAKTALIDCIILPMQRIKQAHENNSHILEHTIETLRKENLTLSLSKCSTVGGICWNYKLMFYIDVYFLLPVSIVIVMVLTGSVIYLIVKCCKEKKLRNQVVENTNAAYNELPSSSDQ